MTKLKSKRLLSFLLSLAMIFTLVSVPVYADETDTGTEATTASTSVATVGDTSYESLSAAVAAVTTEGTETTITLTADTTESGSITVASGKNIVLDLAGHTVTMGSYTVSVYGSLTIQDSTATTEPSISDDYETVTYTSGKITSTTTGTTVTAFNGGTVTLAGGTVEATRGIALRAYNSSGVDSATTVNATGGYAVSQEFTVLVMGSKATANISGGVLVANDNAVVGGNGQSQYAGTSITISGGTLIGHIQTSGYVACGIYHPQEGTLTITGGTIYADGGCGILMRGGTLTMTGGTIITTATTNSGLTDGAGKVGDSRIVVDASGIIYDLDSNYYDVSNVSITLSEDVTVDSTDDAVTVVDTDGDYTDSTITITGGTYSSDVSAYYDTETYTTVTNADGSVTVVASDDVTDTAAASITVDGVTTYYSTLAAAVADVPVGTSADDLGTDTTITILRNIDDAEGVSIPSYVNLTIDFGGYTYTITGPGAGSSNTQTNAFQLLKDSNITMKNGTVQIAENPSRIYRIIQSYANLTLEDMTFYSANQLGGEDYCLSFNYGTVTIKGSTSIISSSSNVIAFDVYYWNNSAYADGTTVIFDEDYTGTITGVILYDTTDASKATLEINGSGTFGGVELSSSAESLDTASITITGGTFGNDVDEYCTTVYTTEVNDDGTYTVITAQVASITDSEGSTTYYSTLAKAFAAAQDGDTITLLEDVILNSSLVCDCGDETSVTLELNGCTITFAYDSDGQFNGETLTDGAWGLKVASGTLTIQDTSDNGTGGIQTADVNTCVDVVGAAGSSTLNITSGSYTTNSIYEAVVYASGSASVNISGGTFTNSATAYAYNSEYTAGLTLNIGNSSSATINVTGGTFYGRSPAEGDDYQTETASTFVNESYKASAISDENGDGFIVVEASAVAVVYDADGNYTGSYTTLKTAYAAVSDGGTMILVDDVTNEQLGASSSKAVTLDLNGHTISRSTGSVIDSSKGTLTITDSSETDSAIGTGMVKNTGGVAVKLTGGSVVLESGTLESTSSYAVTLSSGALTVNGGAVIAGSNANCIVYYTSGTLTINGGLFTVVGRVSDVTEGSVTSGAIVNAGSSATKTDDVQVSITGGVFQTYRPLLGTSIN
ncbi:MAG: hypothetical protein LIP11_07395, partial [Clostridiales bacterium]|nr:hypothetical protein [Clostridiales bacterium]